MSLDIYAGPISRYLVGDYDPDASPWRTPVNTGDGDADSLALDLELVELAEARAKAWREKLNVALQGKASRPLTWDDETNRPFLAKQPGERARDGLVLWAAYLSRTDLDRPMALPTSLADDPAYADAPSKNYYLGAMAVFECQVFVPSDDNFIAPSEHPAGYPSVVTSLSNLRFYLADINAASWNANPSTVASWLKAPSVGAPGDEIQAAAREGFAVFDAVCRFAEAQSAPILVSA